MQPTPHELPDLEPGTPARVAALAAPPGRGEWLQQLQDLGFVEGEAVQVLRRGFPGGDPLVVRVGHSTYALRRAEAACVRVVRVPPTAP